MLTGQASAAVAFVTNFIHLSVRASASTTPASDSINLAVVIC